MPDGPSSSAPIGAPAVSGGERRWSARAVARAAAARQSEPQSESEPEPQPPERDRRGRERQLEARRRRGARAAAAGSAAPGRSGGRAAEGRRPRPAPVRRRTADRAQRLAVRPPPAPGRWHRRSSSPASGPPRCCPRRSRPTAGGPIRCARWTGPRAGVVVGGLVVGWRSSLVIGVVVFVVVGAGRRVRRVAARARRGAPAGRRRAGRRTRQPAADQCDRRAVRHLRTSACPPLRGATTPSQRLRTRARRPALGPGGHVGPAATSSGPIELEGVIAHELAHVKRHDNGVSCVGAHARPAVRGEGLLRRCVGRSREYRADVVAASAVRYPRGLFDALRLMERRPSRPEFGVRRPARFGATRYVWIDPSVGHRDDPMVTGDLDATSVRAAALSEW